jgi:hypothetical protein
MAGWMEGRPSSTRQARVAQEASLVVADEWSRAREIKEKRPMGDAVREYMFIPRIPTKSRVVVWPVGEVVEEAVVEVVAGHEANLEARRVDQWRPEWDGSGAGESESCCGDHARASVSTRERERECEEREHAWTARAGELELELESCGARCQAASSSSSSGGGSH